MPELQFRGVQTEEELRRANHLMAQSFSSDGFQGLRWLEQQGAGYPGFRREHVRVAMLGDEVAAAHRISTDTIRIGEARLKLGGVGWVATAAHRRKKGLSSRLLGESLRVMAKQRYHVAMLFGIPNFYHRFGFTTTLADYAATVPAIEASSVQHPNYRVRRGKPGDIRAIQRIHNQCDGAVACSLVRTGAHMTSLWERWKPVRVVTDARGKVTGYFLPDFRSDELRIVDAGVADRAACGAVVHACARLAREDYDGRIRFLGPPVHPLLRYLLQYRSTHEMRITRDEGGMMAFVDLPEALESMIPEWESLVLASAVRALRAEFTLVVGRRPYRVRSNRGAIDVSAGSGPNKLSLSCAELMHLMTGYRYLDEVLQMRRRSLTTESRALLAAIFPKRWPYVWEADRF